MQRGREPYGGRFGGIIGARTFGSGRPIRASPAGHSTILSNREKSQTRSSQQRQRWRSSHHPALADRNFPRRGSGVVAPHCARAAAEAQCAEAGARAAAAATDSAVAKDSAATRDAGEHRAGALSDPLNASHSQRRQSIRQLHRVARSRRARFSGAQYRRGPVADFFRPAAAQRRSLRGGALGATTHRRAALDQRGFLHLAGYFPTQPLQINFDLLFQNVANHWRLYGISISTPQPPTAGR